MLGLVGIFAWRAAADKPLSFGDPFPDLTTDQLIQFSDGEVEFTATSLKLGSEQSPTTCLIR